jgi:hypothetical protein
MASQNFLLLTSWLLAAAISVTYVALRSEPVKPGFSISSQQDDATRDRPLGSWGTYLPRPILRTDTPAAVAKAPALGWEQPAIASFQKQDVVEVPKVEPTVPHPSQPSAAAEAAQKRAQEALLGAENEQLALKSIPAKAPKSTAKLPSARKKVITEGRKRRFARRGGGLGRGLFALSGDFGRPTSY